MCTALADLVSLVVEAVAAGDDRRAVDLAHTAYRTATAAERVQLLLFLGPRCRPIDGQVR